MTTSLPPEKLLLPLGKDIRLLGNLLGRVIREQCGDDGFELVEKVRLTAKARRSGEASAADRLADTINNQDLDSLRVLIKAFTHYFQLINIAEDQHRVRVLRQREAENGLVVSIDAAINNLHAAGASAEDVRELLDKVRVRLVLTAHPTEAKRKEILVKLRHIAQMITIRDVQRLLPREERALETALLEEIEEMWQTQITRASQPTAIDEMDFGLYFITNTIMDLAIGIHDDVQTGLDVHYPDHDWTDLPPLLSFATWIGADRDGNPNVTPEVTLRVLDMLSQAARRVYLDEIAFLREHLTQSTDEIGVSERLLESIAQVEDTYPGEPYRQQLSLIWVKLDAGQYKVRQELLDDLYIMEESLLQNQGTHVARGHLGRLIQKVRLFGLHLVPLEVREDARRQAAALDEIFRHYGLCESYLDLPEADRQTLLTREIANPRPLFPPDPKFSEDTNDVIAIWRMIAAAHSRYGNGVIDTFIASMSKAPSDVLAMLLLANEVGADRSLDLVPLFETTDDLWRASEVLAQLFANPAYRQHLEHRSMHQQVMVGYSDSSKDGGLLASAWGLYAAQQAMSETCIQHGVSLEVFHGRGGSVGRGGGPAGKAILSQPPASVQGRLKITEQGEVIAFRYSNAAIGRRHLNQVMHAALLATWMPPDDIVRPEWLAAMDRMSEVGRQAYRKLVYETPDFITYWHQATPINELTQLKIGSRPARRSAVGFEAIRAIPWVFSWMQSRALIPSWYGIGSALESWCQEKDDGLEILQTMYQEWAFFQALAENVEFDLVKADMGIAELYASLVEDEAIRDSIFTQIKTEHERARRFVSAITGQEELLDRRPVMKVSIERRNPYVDPLSFIQVTLLRELRQLQPGSHRYDALLHAVLATINGISAGMKNTG